MTMMNKPTNSSNVPGQGHAPGKKAIVAVPASFMPSDPSLRDDNGKIVVLVTKVTAGYKFFCAGCGISFQWLTAPNPPVWIVEADSARLVSSQANCYGTEGNFQQAHLIPLGDDLTPLLKEEDKKLTEDTISSISLTPSL